MINVVAKAHRGFLLANNSDAQKLFVMLKLIPGQEAAAQRPTLSIALVVDTSGSMQAFADQEKSRKLAQQRGLSGTPGSNADGGCNILPLDLPTRLDLAVDACQKLVNDQRLSSSDQLAVIQFDTNASALLPLQTLSDRAHAAGAVENLRKHSGETWMAKGLKLARKQMAQLQPSAIKRVLLFTDGATVDEPGCKREAGAFAEMNCPITAIGVGDEYNAELLSEIASISAGRVYPLEDMQQFDATLQDELGSSVREVITNLRMTVSGVKGVQLDSVTRVYPFLADVPMDGQPFRMGNLEKGDYTVFLLDLTVQGLKRPPSEARLARIILSGEIPGLGRTWESSPQDVRITFTLDQAKAEEVDEEVSKYAQDRTVDSIRKRAAALASRDPQGATRLLEQAKSMTRRLGNDNATRQLEAAENELKSTGTLSAKTQRITSLGGRTKTIKHS